MKLSFVFDDWRGPDRSSIYQTDLGVALSAGDLHSGSTWNVIVLGLPDEIRAEIRRAHKEHGAYPVVRMMPVVAHHPEE